MKNKKPKNKEELSPESGRKKRINSRVKGSTYERWLATMFKEKFGYKFAKTTRNSSKMMDDSGIDISGIPYNVQAKSGYWDRRPKADEIFKSMKDTLLKNFDESDVIHKHPKFLFHKLDMYNPNHHLVTMTFEDWLKIMEVYEKHKNKETSATTG